ncbi:MAG TPA: BON domain-containing protein [Gammaproteobacteria bacterium]|nr:BON domain-containing protein [Gammaproteobacteria bacterium]
MNSSTRARRSGPFRLTPAAAARLSFVLSLGLTGAATLAAAPALYAQQDAARSDLAIQTDVVKAISSYPDLSGEHITATAKNGVVTLAGTASSSTAKSQAQVVAATVDGVQSVVNNVTVTGGAQNDAQADPGDPGDQDVQQAQSTDPNQQQAPYTPQQQPKPGASGQWGQAGPPPDVQNGQIPSQPQENQQAGQPSDQNPEQEPAPPQQPAYGNPNGQYPQQGYPPPPQQGYGQQQGYAQQPYGGQNRGYAAPHLASTPLTIPPGTLFSVRTSEPLDSRRLKGGENFQMTLAQDIYQGQYLVIPRGAVLQGTVIGVKKPGALRGDAGFALQITSLTIGGQSYPVSTDTFATDTRGKGGYTAANTVGGAAIGALIGAAAGGGAGAGIGALIGGGAGLGASAASAGPRSIMPPETLLTFHLKAPLTVSPISLSEVQQLQASVAPRPVRRPRPPYPYGYPPPPPPPGYYYPYRY